MLLRTYRGDDLEQALAKVKADLGDQATIVSSRRVRRGLLSSELEVTATLPTPRPSRQPRASAAAELRRPTAPTRTLPHRAPPRVSSPALEARLVAQAVLPLRKEIERLRAELAQLAAGVGRRDQEERRLERALGELLEVANEVALPGYESPLAVGDGSLQGAGSRGLRETFEATGMSSHHAAELSAAVADEGRTSSLEGLPLSHVAAAVVQRRLCAMAPLEQGSEPRRVALVGPAGVGKSTTLAKVAVRAALVERRSVAIIGFDNERVGAAASVKSLAASINVPCWVATSGAQLQQALARFSEKSLVLIDTSGYAPRQRQELLSLGEILATAGVEAHLLLSAELREMEMESVLAAYALLGPQSLSLTKVDQTLSHGAIYDAAVRCPLPLLYLSTGRRIPEDLEEATPARVASLVLGLQYN